MPNQLTKEQLLSATPDELRKLAGLENKDCFGCLDCRGCWECQNCYNCQNQVGKQYMFCNVQLSEDEYWDLLGKL